MKNYLKIIYDLKANDNLRQEDVFNALNYEERKDLFLGTVCNYTNYDFIDKCNNSGIFLFSYDEFKDLIAEGRTQSLIYSKLLIHPDLAVSMCIKALDNDLSFQLSNDDVVKYLNDNDLKKLLVVFRTRIYLNDDDIHNLGIILKMIRDDDFKDKFLEEMYSSGKIQKKSLAANLVFSVVKSFDSDEYKKKWLRKTKRSARPDVVVTLEDDHQKFMYSLPFNSENKEKVLLSFNDQKFIKKLVLTPSVSKKIITRIADEEEREKYFRRLNTMIRSEDKGSIVASFKSREKQLELMSYLKTEIAKWKFVRESHALTDGDIWKIAKEFRSDARILDAAMLIKDNRIKNELLMRLKDHKAIVSAASIVRQEGIFENLIDKLTDRERKSIFTYGSIDKDNLRFDLISRIKDKNWIFKTFEHIELGEYQPENIDYFCDLYSKTYKLNKEHLKVFAQEFGYGVFKYISSNRIKEAINLDEENFKKYMQLFNKNNFITNEITTKNSLFALAQQEYKHNNDFVINRFAYILHALDANNFDEAKRLISMLVRDYVEEVAEFLEISPTPRFQKLTDIVLEKMCEKDNTRIKNFIHNLADDNVERHRAYLTKKLADNSFSELPKEVNNKSLLNWFIYKVSPSEFREELKDYYKYFDDSERKFIDSDRFEKIIKFKQSPEANKLDDNLKPDLKLFNVIMRKAFEHGLNNSNLCKLASFMPDAIKEVDYDNSKNYEALFSLLQQINPKQLTETIFNSKEKYESLLEFISKSKIMGTAPFLTLASERASIPIDESLVSNMINNYAAISDNLASKNQRVNLVDYLVEADYFNSESIRYENLFGRDIFRLIKNNPAPNTSSHTRQERIEKAIEFVDKVSKRKYLTVPPQDRNYTSSDGKTLNVRIGDLHNLDNLVHGERTGACMRIGGAANDLFEFCLLNENGFHMVFTNPETGKFVSRVSGFRNGNTVFFNELRYSLDDKYTNKDLFECMQQASQYMIEQTKKSNKPVDNVVVSKYYAMSSLGLDTSYLGVPDIKNGIGDFYSDVDSDAVVVATSEKKANFAEVVLDSKNPRYEGIRKQPVYFEGKEAKAKIDHLKTLRCFLRGQEVDELEVPSENVLSCYATEEWGVYYDLSGELKMIAAVDNREVLNEMRSFSKKLKCEIVNKEDLDAKSR